MKKTLVILIVGMMVFGAAGCGGAKNDRYRPERDSKATQAALSTQAPDNTQPGSDNTQPGTPADNTQPGTDDPVGADTPAGTDNTPADTQAPAASQGGEYDEWGYIKRMSCGIEEAGIYAIVITFNMDLMPENGGFRYLYFNNEHGTEEQCCDYEGHYTKNADGTYNAACTYNGMVDMNYYNKTELKINNTFGAMTRADRAEIYIIDADGVETKIYDIYK